MGVGCGGGGEKRDLQNGRWVYGDVAEGNCCTCGEISASKRTRDPIWGDLNEIPGYRELALSLASTRCREGSWRQI